MSNPEDKKIMGKLSGKELTEQEIFEAKQNLLGFLALLLDIDRRHNPHLYQNHEPLNPKK